MATSPAPSGILGLDLDAVSSHALVVGDPHRVREVAAHLEDVRTIGDTREYLSITGRYRDRAVTVTSHGVGAAGAAVCFEELLRAGVTTIVRAGTCGGLQHGVVEGDLVVGTAAVRDDGVTDRLVPLGWPAVADGGLTRGLQAAAGGAARDLHVGVVHTVANFFPSPVEGMPGWQVWADAGALAIEMEFSALLIVAALHGARAAGVFAVDGNLRRDAADMAGYDPDRDIVRSATAAMLTVALDALAADEG
ncbi:MAG: nucleoside phosphorylase [Nitriliruptoraceae bacterium]|nr:nucleoside phosphorylase [Nitriliruptoraceae bacterium]